MEHLVPVGYIGEYNIVRI